MMNSTSSNRHALYLAMIFAVTLALYWNSLYGEFIWDDRGLILDNTTYLNNWMNLYAGFYKPFFCETNYYRPFLTGSFIIDYQLWGINSFGYHFTNLVLHIANALLVYSFIFILFHKANTALLTSLLFAAHPVQSEAVAWISGRNDLLLTFFALISIIAHLRWTCYQGWRRQLAYSCCLLAYGSALLTKESAIVLPLLFMLMDYFYPGSKKNKTRDYAGIVLVSVVYYFAKSAVMGDTGIALREGELVHVLSGMIVTYAYYFRMLIFPLFQSAVPEISGSGFDNQFVIISSFCLVFCLLMLAIICLKRFKDISCAIFWVIVSLIPVCGIVPLSLPALEHRLYLATVCFSMMLPLAAGRLSCLQTQTKKMNKAKAIALVIAPAVLIFYSAKTVTRNAIWNNELSFWSKAVHDSPDSSVATGGLGLVYARAGEYQMAIREFKKALALTDQKNMYVPGHSAMKKWKLFNNLGQSYFQLLRKRVPVETDSRPAVVADEKNAERVRNDAQRLYELSLACYQSALRISPASADVHNNLGDLFYVMNNYHDAEEEYREALKHNPGKAQYYNNLGLVSCGLKNYEGAEEKFTRAISLQHDFLEARNNLALVYLHRGMYQKALEQLEMVLSYGPDDNAGVYFNLALVYLRGFHDSERAAYYLRESLRLNRHISKDQMVRDSSCGRSDGRAVDRHT